MSLRLRLLLAASLLLAVPLAGYRFVLAMETYLRERQVDSAASMAHVLAQALQERPDLIDTSPAAADGEVLHVHSLAHDLQIDGYDGDWGQLALHGAGDEVRAAQHDSHLFLLLALRAAPAGARVRLVMDDAPGFRRAWLLDASLPGATGALEVPPESGAISPAYPDNRIQAGAQRGADLTRIEIRMPLGMHASALHFEVLEQTRVVHRVPARGVLHLLLPAPGLAPLLNSLISGAGRRVRITDTRGHVLAQAGALPVERSAALAALLEHMLEVDDPALLSLSPDTLMLDGPELHAALAGTPAARLRRAEDGASLVVSAARPLRVGARIVGAMVLEESTSPIEALARRALVELALSAAAAFLLASSLLLLVAGRTAARLRALRDQAARAIDTSGRVGDTFGVPSGRDEIGDLARSFAAALARLRGYQEYLEQLARRLSHELRTPIAVIRSSLENLTLAGDGKPHAPATMDPALGRALEGAARLDGLVRRMSEATRLEQAISDSEREHIDLCALVRSAAQGYAMTSTQPVLTTRLAPEAIHVSGSDELLLQALDKLIANARDFAAPGTPITLVVARHGARVRLAVENRGTPLPAGDRGRLFDSMVSVRTSGGDTPHLGLGLHVVELVARFHGAQVFAEDLEGGGACVGMELPLTDAGHTPTSYARA